MDIGRERTRCADTQFKPEDKSMNGNEPESSILAQWVIDRFARHRTDAQNVELEAYAEEREAEAYSREISGWRRPHPRLVDLLATGEFMVELTDIMLRTLPPKSPEAQFVTKIQGEMKAICEEIRTQIFGGGGSAQRTAPSK
jgi:hypothetical protein